MESFSALFIFEVDAPKHNQRHIGYFLPHVFASEIDHHVLVLIVSDRQGQYAKLTVPHVRPENIIS